MKIKFRDYIIESSPHAIGKYDLYLKRISEGEKHKGEEYIVNRGYAMRMSTIVKAICSMEATKEDNVMELKDFLKHYNEITEKVIEELKIIN